MISAQLRHVGRVSHSALQPGGVARGRELSHFGLREFTNPQVVWTKCVN